MAGQGQGESSAISTRTILVAVLWTTFIATAGYFNDQVLRMTHFVGNQFPIIVFFPLIAVAALLCPLLGRWKASWRLKPVELAVITALTLAACNVPGSGLMRWWSRMAGGPVYHHESILTWKQADILSYAPPELLMNNGTFDRPIVEQFWLGESEPLSVSDVPWGAWRGPIVGWMPLAILFAVASICLAVIVHRTWATRERLPYPIAQLANSVIDGSSRRGGIFTDKRFLIGAAIVLAIHLINGTYTWYLGSGFRDPLFLDFAGPLFTKFPKELGAVPWGGNSVFYFPIYPTLIALACFVATDVSFSVGISVVAWTFIGYLLYLAGVKFEWIWVEGGTMPWQTAGSSIALGAALLYIGRTHYHALLRRAMGLASSQDVTAAEVWACRIFLVSAVGLVWMLTAFGVGWPMAIVAVLLFLLAYVVLARITVESGVMLVQMQWQPLAVLVGLMGVKALGLRSFVVLGMLSMVFSAERRECLMPLMLNGLRVCDGRGPSTGRVSRWAVAIFIIALAVAVPFGLWTDHSYVVKDGEGFSTAAPWIVFNAASRQHKELSTANELATSDAYSTFERIANAEPEMRCLVALAVGAAVVLLLTALRLRFWWWPIHPILFIIWGTWAARVTAFSFLVGWAIKTVSFHLGLRHASLKTFMIGVIAGDLTGGVFWMIFGAAWWYITGEKPVRYHVFPGG